MYCFEPSLYFAHSLRLDWLDPVWMDLRASRFPARARVVNPACLNTTLKRDMNASMSHVQIVVQPLLNN